MSWHGMLVYLSTAIVYKYYSSQQNRKDGMVECL